MAVGTATTPYLQRLGGVAERIEVLVQADLLATPSDDCLGAAVELLPELTRERLP